MNDPKIIVALDYWSTTQLKYMIDALDPSVCKVKIGLQSFIVGGRSMVEYAVNKGFDVLLDLKLHDIPTTVKNAVVGIEDLGLWGLTVHVCGGPIMLLAAAEGRDVVDPNMKIIGVTVLTSFNDQGLHQGLQQVGINVPVAQQVHALGQLAYDNYLDGVVCSPHEARDARLLQPSNSTAPWITVCPGIRQLGSAPDDQQRTMAPKDAIDAGADYLVIGRPITHASDPTATLDIYNNMIQPS